MGGRENRRRGAGTKMGDIRLFRCGCAASKMTNVPARLEPARGTRAYPESMSTDDASFDRARNFAVLATILSFALGIASLAHAWMTYPDMPERVPIHFGVDGAPDGWANRSLGAALALPLMALVMGGGIGLLGLLSTGAGHRPPPEREKLRAALPPLAIFLGVIALLSSALMAGLSYDSVRVALGRQQTLGWWPLAGGVLMGGWAIAGAIYFLVKHSPIGGSHGEEADPKRWKWGVFYVAPEDPSLFVEKRWGGGYTINFGIPAGRRIGWGMLAVFAAMIAVVAWLIASS